MVELRNIGGVGFDINCGVRLIRTNFDYHDVKGVQEQLAQALFNHIPVGVGSKGVIPILSKDLEEALVCTFDPLLTVLHFSISLSLFLLCSSSCFLPILFSISLCMLFSDVTVQELGMDWSVREGYAWPEDKEHCEEYGRMLNADPRKVSKRAKKRGLPQVGVLRLSNASSSVMPSCIFPAWNFGCRKSLCRDSDC